MQTGAITEYIDVAQIVLYVFWFFFAGLIFYLQREGKREGYPLESDRTEISGGKVKVVGYPEPPPPRTYIKPHGGSVEAPRPPTPERPIAAVPAAGFLGAPLEPTGDPMVDGVGPGAYAMREDAPDLTWEGDPKIVPLRVATDHWLNEKDPDPRGMPVVCLDKAIAGTVSEAWIDRSETRVLYLEVTLNDVAEGEVPTRLLPINFCKVHASGYVKVVSILAEQFKRVPVLRNPDQVTLLEEDKICAYFGGGTLYAWPQRKEPLL
jgi:photosynthetic reaction center H subunit